MAGHGTSGTARHRDPHRRRRRGDARARSGPRRGLDAADRGDPAVPRGPRRPEPAGLRVHAPHRARDRPAPPGPPAGGAPRRWGDGPGPLRQRHPAPDPQPRRRARRRAGRAGARAPALAAGVPDPGAHRRGPRRSGVAARRVGRPDHPRRVRQRPDPGQPHVRGGLRPCPAHAHPERDARGQHRRREPPDLRPPLRGRRAGHLRPGRGGCRAGRPARAPVREPGRRRPVTLGRAPGHRGPDPAQRR